jgi:hypothetical protein
MFRLSIARIKYIRQTMFFKKIKFNHFTRKPTFTKNNVYRQKMRLKSEEWSVNRLQDVGYIVTPNYLALSDQLAY